MGSSYERILGQHEGQIRSISVLLKEPVHLTRADIEKALIMAEVVTDNWLQINPVIFALQRVGLGCTSAGPLEIIVKGIVYHPSIEMNATLRTWRAIHFDDSRQLIYPLRDLAKPIPSRTLGFQ